jgi:hypothetical protein
LPRGQQATPAATLLETVFHDVNHDGGRTIYERNMRGLPIGDTEMAHLGRRREQVVSSDAGARTRQALCPGSDLECAIPAIAKSGKHNQNQLTTYRPGAIQLGCLVPTTNIAMTLTDDELSDPTAELTGGDDAHRRPITDVNAWLDGLDCDVRPTLRALGELLVGVAKHETAESADKFTARCLGVPDSGHLLDEEHELNPVYRLAIPRALAEWIDAHAGIARSARASTPTRQSGRRPRSATNATASRARKTWCQ